MGRILAALIFPLVLATPELGWAQAPVTQLEIAVDDDLEVVRGVLRRSFRNSSDEPLGQLLLWLPFNRLARPPEGLDQRNAHWIYPRAFEPGQLVVEEIRWGDRQLDPARLVPFPHPSLDDDQRALVALPLPEPLAPGEAVTLELRFQTRVPDRFGRLGRAEGVLTLAGGFYPQPARVTADGWQLSEATELQRFQVRLTAPAGVHVVANERSQVMGGAPLELDLEVAPYLALVIAPRFSVTRLLVGDVVVELLSQERRYQRPAPERGFRHPLTPADTGDATRWDWQGRILATARSTLRVLAELGRELPPGQVVRLVEVPLRLELASPIPSGALISDRTYRLTPLEQFFRFHDLQVARAVGWIALRGLVRRETPADRGWVLDLLAAAVADAFARSEHGGRGPGLRRLLRVGAFIPEIDQLLYSPVIEFRHLFLRPFRDEDPLRDEPWRLASVWPRGAVLHDKLVDLLGEEAVEAVLRSYPEQRTPLRTLVAQQAEEPMGWFFDQWLGPYPAVNYRLVEVDSEPLGDGRVRHRVVVERQGEAIREPVEVRLHLDDGSREDLRWDGRGDRGELSVVADSGLDRVEVDPRNRLLESAAVAGDNPNFDNVSPQRWRPPVLNGLLLYLSAAESQLYALVDFSLRRQYDARQAFRLRLEYDPRGIRGDLFYQRGLGRLLDLDRASWVISGGVNVLRTFGDFAGGETEAEATAFGAAVSLYHDTRWYRYDPMEGWGLRLSVFGGGSVDDDGAWGWSVGASGRAAGHLTPRVGHTFTLYGGAGVVFGDPLDEQLQSSSDRSMLRAFEADETLGRARLYAGVEYRWAALTDLDVNLFHLAWWRTLFLAVFVAGGTASRPEDLSGLFTPERLFTEVGAGVRVLLDIAGVLPYIIAVDVAYPLTPRQRLRCGETQCVPRAPVGVYVSIEHTM